MVQDHAAHDPGPFALAGHGNGRLIADARGRVIAILCVHAQAGAGSAPLALGANAALLLKSPDVLEKAVAVLRLADASPLTPDVTMEWLRALNDLAAVCDDARTPLVFPKAA